MKIVQAIISLHIPQSKTQSLCSHRSIIFKGKGGPGTFDLQSRQTEVVGNLGTYFLWKAFTVGREWSCGLKPVRSELSLVRWWQNLVDLQDTQLVSWKIAWCADKSPHFGDPSVRREVFSVMEQETYREERYRQGELGYFTYIERWNIESSLFTKSPPKGTVDTKYFPCILNLPLPPVCAALLLPWETLSCHSPPQVFLTTTEEPKLLS